jgi:hypothetical protein
MNLAEITGQWWNRHQIAIGKTSYWQIGPLHLWVKRLPHQWFFAWTHTDNWLDSTVKVLSQMENEEPPPHIEQARFTFKDAGTELSFAPRLADRAIVTWLETPIHVLPGEEVVMYVSTPLWIRAEMTGTPQTLQDVTCFRLSDTWLGDVTSIGGELAYASRTRAVFQLEDITLRPHTAITAVRLRNLGETQLPLDRINLPMQRLSLFYSAKTGFWTDTMILERRDDEAEFANLRLDQQAPPEAAPTQFVAPPRVAADSHTVVRAFNSLFREKGVQ